LRNNSLLSGREARPVSTKRLGPCILEGAHVRLEPLRQEHAEDLLTVARELDWSWFLRPLKTKADIDRRIAKAAEEEEAQTDYAFVVKAKPGGKAIGSTSYLHVDSENKTTEIGSTWYTPSAQGTKVNPECKYLLMKRAFEGWGAVRVQFVTDVNNLHSQRAILKLGAKFEGKLRSHKIRVDGSTRDSMVYSVVSAEWPAVKERLLARINGP